MVDQNMNPGTPGGTTSSPGDSAPPPPPKKMAEPSVIQAGQMMLIFALVLIFLVCCAAATHFHLRRQKRKRRKKAKVVKKKVTEEAETEEVQESELQSRERKVAELVGTPICEMGDSEPRHEMEDVEVPERRYTMADIDIQNPADTPVVTRTERELEEGTYFGEMTSREELQPEARVYAAYWARAF